MAKRPQNESSIRKLTKLGKKSLAVTIPIGGGERNPITQDINLTTKEQ